MLIQQKGIDAFVLNLIIEKEFSQRKVKTHNIKR